MEPAEDSGYYFFFFAAFLFVAGAFFAAFTAFLAFLAFFAFLAATVASRMVLYVFQRDVIRRGSPENAIFFFGRSEGGP